MDRDRGRERPRSGNVLGEVGQAVRRACPDEGPGAELWCLPLAAVGIARRLSTLGAEGLGGFEGPSGTDDDGAFAVRRVPVRTVADLSKGEALDASTALRYLRDFARALAAAENAAIFPGALGPSSFVLPEGEARAWILAEPWVRAIVGESRAGGADGNGPSKHAKQPGASKWTPPEQGHGAPWDNAANRYVLGLVVYRLIAGNHPFSGLGLRDVHRAQGTAPPPFADAIARSLRPGVQSLVLTMLDPDASRRPPSARAILASVEAVTKGDAVAVPPAGVALRASPSSRSVVRAERDSLSSKRAQADASKTAPGARRSWWRSAPSKAWLPSRASVAPLLLGLVVGGGALAASKGAEPPPTPQRTVLTQHPLTQTSAETCAPCHARQVAEWQRSVMAHAVKSPLFGALESVVEEQVGRDFACPNGAGVLRRAGDDVCRDERTGTAVTGAGGEHWCVNCHAAGDNLRSSMPSWSASSTSKASRKPLRDLLSPQATEGISCAVCHQTIGPVHVQNGGSDAVRSAGYRGNATWTSTASGITFAMRPEDQRGVAGIGNSGYLLDASSFLRTMLGGGAPGDPVVHARASSQAKSYLTSSEFCGACHDVRLFGTDAVGGRERGEHFKRLRNAYSEWRSWADAEKAAGRSAATCQDCHMSLYPGICVPDGAPKPSQPASTSAPDSTRARDRAGERHPETLSAGRDGCPSGFHFEARAPGEKPRAMVASSSTEPRSVSVHYFSSVDVPLANDFPDAFRSNSSLDAHGLPLGVEPRREQLLRRTFRFGIGNAARAGDRLTIPIEIQNVGAGHRAPAGFSQEREIWVELTVRNARGAVVYEVGHLPNDDADLADKRFLRIATRDDSVDARGRPLGVFGADIVDGPDVPRWSPNPTLGGTLFRGQGLVNLQNGFLRCVRCIGIIDGAGRCQPGPGQGRTRADRFDDGFYDLDSGECRSNLSGSEAFFETYFPIGALDADRGVAKAPDAILDTRSAPPGVRLQYIYELDAAGHSGPFTVTARLRFRPFPPFLLRAFADYEANKAAAGLRPSGPQLTTSMFERNRPVDIGEATATVDSR